MVSCLLYSVFIWTKIKETLKIRTVFLEIKEIIAEIKEHPCQIEGNSTTCIYTVTSSFLYIFFALILNDY